jgi:hypothetical protein
MVWGWMSASVRVLVLDTAALVPRLLFNPSADRVLISCE